MSRAVTMTFGSLEKALLGSVDTGIYRAAQALRDDGIVPIFGTDHGGVPSSPGSPPHSQSGELRDSWKIERGERKSSVYSSVPYAAILETGGTITPKRAKALAVPVSPEAKKRAARMGARAAIASFGNTRTVKTKRGNLLIVRDVRGKRARGEVLFFLAGKVRIAARPYVDRSIESAWPAMETVFVETVMRSIERADK